MPASRRTSSRSRTTSDYDDNKEKPTNVQYKDKRKRNNAAVRKTREKTKEAASQRAKNVEKLKNDISEMEGKIKEKEEHVKTLKSLILQDVKRDPEDVIKTISDGMEQH